MPKNFSLSEATEAEDLKERILQELLRSNPTEEFVSHLDLAERLGLDAEHVRASLLSYKAMDYVALVHTFTHISASITPQGRQSLTNATRLRAYERTTERKRIEKERSAARELESVLLEKTTMMGVHAPAYMVVELRQKQAEIEKLEQRLEELKQADETGEST